MSELNLSSYEQSALAELSSICHSIKYKFDTEGVAAVEYFDSIISVIDKFDKIKWDQLYDKLHRTGANF